MGIDTNEGYLGHDEVEDDSKNSELRDYIKPYQIGNRIVYRDTRTGRFISEKGLAKKTE